MYHLTVYVINEPMDNDFICESFCFKKDNI